PPRSTLFPYTTLFRSQLDMKRNAGKPMGSLHGVVIALKDIIAYKEHRLTASSKILNGFTSIYSATATEKLLREEAIIIGSCNCRSEEHTSELQSRSDI